MRVGIMRGTHFPLDRAVETLTRAGHRCQIRNERGTFRQYRRRQNLRVGRKGGLMAALSSHLLGAEAEHHLVGAFVAKWPAEQIALDGVAAEIAHPLEIFGGLDTLSGDRHAE